MMPSQYAAPQGIYESKRYTSGPTYGQMAMPLLAPGERPYGVVKAQLSDLIRRVPRKYRGKEMGGAAAVAYGAVEVLVDFAGLLAELVEDLTWGLIRSFRRLLRGRGLTGGWQSQAGRFTVAVRAGDSSEKNYDNDRVYLVFTDRRILLAAEFRDRMEALGELPYQQLVKVKNRRTWISGRVDLTFADGSLVALEADEDDARALQSLGPR